MNEESVYRAAFWIQIGCQMLMAYYYSRNIRRSGRKSALTGESVEREGMGRFIDRSLILLYFPVVLMLSGCTSSTVPPNVILIMADDLGYETLRINGGLSYETPRLDALAAEGMRFTQAYSMPLCTPSRVQIMTGRYNFRNYIGFGLLDPAEKTFCPLSAGRRVCDGGVREMAAVRQLHAARNVRSVRHVAGGCRLR